MLTLEKINKIKDPIRRRKLKEDLVNADEAADRKEAHSDFLSFVKHMWPEFIEGSHHARISEKFNKLASGEITRLIINMPPRHTKSEFASYFLPAWMIGKNSKLKIIQAKVL